MVKRGYSTFQLLRYPLVFGACLSAYFIAFSFRKTYFKDDIEEQRQKNLEQSRLDTARLEEARKKRIQAQHKT